MTDYERSITELGNEILTPEPDPEPDPSTRPEITTDYERSITELGKNFNESQTNELEAMQPRRLRTVTLRQPNPDP